MQISIDTITGISIGIEYIKEDREIPNTVILDACFVRFLFQWRNF